MNKKAVFACNELDLKEVNVYGFDYDYTLAHYKPSMDFLLYKLGRDTLIEKYKVRINDAFCSLFMFCIYIYISYNIYISYIYKNLVSRCILRIKSETTELILIKFCNYL